MKRNVRMFLLCLCLFGGCATTSVDQQVKTKLKVAVFNGAYETTYWEACKETFEEQHPDVEVELSISANIGNILLPRVDVKDVPDVVYLASSNDSGFTQKMMEDHLIEPLDDLFTEEFEGKFLHNVLDSAQLRPYADHKVYLAPLYYNVTGLWYNVALFDKYGYEIPKTWDEFLALGERAKEDGVSLFTYQGLNPTYLEAMLWPMLTQTIGMEGMDKIYQYEVDAWSQQGVREVLQVFEQIATQGYMEEDTILLSYYEAQKRFLDGEALFLPCGNWLLQEMQDVVVDDEQYAFMQVPSFKEKETGYATVMVEQIYIPSEAKEKELAKAFIEFQYQKDTVEMNQSMSGGLVPVKEELNTNEWPKPYDIFKEGVIPITSNFNVEYGHDMDAFVFEELAKILSKQQTSEMMIAHLNAYNQNIK